MAIPLRFFTFFGKLRTTVTEAKEKLNKGGPIDETLDEVLYKLTQNISNLATSSTSNGAVSSTARSSPRHGVSKAKHLNLKPFHCSRCGASFAKNHNLTRHEQRFHRPGAFIYSCTWEERSCHFTSRHEEATLKHILRKHIGYKKSIQEAIDGELSSVVDWARSFIREN